MTSANPKPTATKRFSNEVSRRRLFVASSNRINGLAMTATSSKYDSRRQTARGRCSAAFHMTTRRRVILARRLYQPSLVLSSLFGVTHSHLPARLPAALSRERARLLHECAAKWA